MNFLIQNIRSCSFFWKNSDPLPFNEILKYCNDELQLNWAVGTAQTYLNRLILKGVLKTNNKRYRKLYSAQLSEEELAQKYARQFVDESFGGSLKNFIASFTQETKLSEADVNELIDILHSNMSEEK
mgnify:CR=1 FL=1